MKITKLLMIFLTVSFKTMPVGSLQDLCIRKVLENPRLQIQQDAEHKLPLTSNLHEAIREKWFANIPQHQESWYWKLMVHNKKLSTITTTQVDDFYLNQDHTLIKVEGIFYITFLLCKTYLEIPCNYKAIHSFEGKRLWEGQPHERILNFAPEQQPVFCDKQELSIWGFKRLLQIKSAMKDNNDKRFLILYNDGQLAMLDLSPSYQFSEFIEKRAPLNVILVLESIRKAHENKEKIVFTPEELKILNGMPPQFERTKQLLKQYGTKSFCVII